MSCLPHLQPPSWRALADACWVEVVAIVGGLSLAALGLWLDHHQHAAARGHSLLPVLGGAGVSSAAIALLARARGWDPQIPSFTQVAAGFRQRAGRLSAVLDPSRGLRLDFLIALVLVLVTAAFAYAASRSIPAAVFDTRTLSVWFESDLSDFMHAMTDRSREVGTNLHPWYFLGGFCFVHALVAIAGMTTLDAVHVFTAAQAGVWALVFYIVLRSICRYRLDAIVLSALGLTSAASVFWLAAPESFIGGSISMLLAVLAIAVAQRKRLSEGVYVALNALTLGFTVTNWMGGIVATVLNQPPRRAVQIIANGFVIAVLLWMVAHIVFPSGDFLFAVTAKHTRYLYTTLNGGPLAVLSAFFFHGMVMPELQLVDRFSPPVANLPGNWPILVTQYSLPGSGTQPWGILAVLTWAVLLVLGVWSFFRLRQHLRLRVGIALLILAQLALHLVYGEETFLYAMHYVPLLVLLVALVTLTRLRPLVLALSALLASTTAINNSIQFDRATSVVACLEQHDTRDRLQRAARTPIDKQALLNLCTPPLRAAPGRSPQRLDG